MMSETQRLCGLLEAKRGMSTAEIVDEEEESEEKELFLDDERTLGGFFGEGGGERGHD